MANYKKSGPTKKISGTWSSFYPIEDSEEPSHSLMLNIFVPDACPYSQTFEHKAKTWVALETGQLVHFMLMKYIGLLLLMLYLFISKVSSRIGASVKGGKGIPLSLLPPLFSLSPLPLSSLLSPFPSLLTLSSLFSSFLSPILIACSFFSSPSPLSRLWVPFPSLPFFLYSFLPSFSPPALFLFLSISFSILFACSHLISTNSLLSPH